METKYPCMEDLLGSLLRTTAHSKLLKIFPHGANLFQRNAASVSAPERAEWFTFHAIFLKVNPGFWSSWLTWRREQHNEGWKSGGKGAQKYGGQENVVQETLTSPVSLPPLHPHWQSWIRKCCVTAMRSITRAQALEVKYSAKFGEKNRAGIKSLSLK